MQIEEELGDTWVDAAACQELSAKRHLACTAPAPDGATVYVDAWEYPDAVPLPAFFAASLGGGARRRLAGGAGRVRLGDGRLPRRGRGRGVGRGQPLQGTCVER